MRRAVMAVCFALVLGVPVGVIAAGATQQGTALLVGVAAAVAVPAAVLGWLLFTPERMTATRASAARRTGTPQSPRAGKSGRGGNSRPATGGDRGWSDRATAAAWRDTMIVTSLVLVVVAFAGFQWPTSYVLLGVVVLGIAAQGIRQVLLSQRAS